MACITNTSCFGCGVKSGFDTLFQNVTGGSQLVVTVPEYMPNREFNDAVSGPVPLDLESGTYSFKVMLEASVIGTQPMIAMISCFGRVHLKTFPY